MAGQFQFTLIAIIEFLKTSMPVAAQLHTGPSNFILEGKRAQEVNA